MESARPLKNSSTTCQGDGSLSLGKALKTATPRAAQKYSAPSGTGLLDLARGSAKLIDGKMILEGEQDIFGMEFDSASWSNGSRAERQLVRRHVERIELVGGRLVFQELVRSELVQCLLVERLLVRSELVQRLLVERLLVRSELVECQLVRCELVERLLEQQRMVVKVVGQRAHHDE